MKTYSHNVGSPPLFFAETIMTIGSNIDSLVSGAYSFMCSVQSGIIGRPDADGRFDSEDFVYKSCFFLLLVQAAQLMLISQWLR